MDLVRFGRGIRALRIRRRWRQIDLAAAARVSPSIVARMERGRGDSVPPRKLDAVAAALGARTEVRLSWNGEGLDRLLDAAHAGLVDEVARVLQAAGWQFVIEASYFFRGERGSIDVLAWNGASRIVLVIEVKSVVPDIQAMIFALDRKARLAIAIARERGWDPVAVGRLLVVGDSRTARRRVDVLSTTFSAAFPSRTAAVKRWLAAPDRSAPLFGLWFLPYRHAVTGRQRVRLTKPPA